MSKAYKIPGFLIISFLFVNCGSNSQQSPAVGTPIFTATSSPNSNTKNEIYENTQGNLIINETNGKLTTISNQALIPVTQSNARITDPLDFQLASYTCGSKIQPAQGFFGPGLSGKQKTSFFLTSTTLVVILTDGIEVEWHELPIILLTPYAKSNGSFTVGAETGYGARIIATGNSTSLNISPFSYSSPISYSLGNDQATLTLNIANDPICQSSLGSGGTTATIVLTRF